MKILNRKILSRAGEITLLKRICRKLPRRADVIVGAGDDCAVVKAARPEQFDYLLKSDSCIEGVHFTSQTKEELIGHKAVGRVLSDIAAMGGEPMWVLVDLVAPSKTPLKHIEKIYAGMNRLARQFGAAIVGGDVSAGRDLQLHVFGVGRVKKGKAILRSGARAGEAIFVTGRLGGSIAGKHLEFQPRLREGQWLASGGWATAMIDLSDGLLRDLRHITAASKVGAQIMFGAVPLSAAARCSAAGNALEHALNDGEDYELLFTVPKHKAGSFIKAWRRQFNLSCVRIGWTTRDAGCLEGINEKGRRVKLEDTGYEHFRRRKGTK